MEEHPTQEESERILEDYLSGFTPEQLAQLREILDSGSGVQDAPAVKSAPRDRSRLSESRAPAPKGKDPRGRRPKPVPRRSERKPNPRQDARHTRLKELPEESQKRYTRRTVTARRLLDLSALVEKSRPDDEELAELVSSLNNAFHTYQEAHRKANDVYLTDEQGATDLWRRADNDLDDILDGVGDRLKLMHQLSEDGKALLDRESVRRRQKKLSESTAKRHEKVLEQHKENKPANEARKRALNSNRLVETLLWPYMEEHPGTIITRGTTCLMMINGEVVSVANSQDTGSLPGYVVEAIASFLPPNHEGARDLATCAEPKAVANLLGTMGVKTRRGAITWLRDAANVACYCFNYEDLNDWKWIQPCTSNCQHWMAALNWKPAA
ncbi:hypothetical protein [Streptomyces sp. NPDC059918]|uniref:hypothetical protein n=1 Tax=unclassified Streptomyces TaxID=2593676 RepID=UPI0036462327